MHCVKNCLNFMVKWFTMAIKMLCTKLKYLNPQSNLVKSGAPGFLKSLQCGCVCVCPPPRP